jgi:5-deoxy-D-glucuronate isomerase
VVDGLPHAMYVPAGLEVSFTATTASAEVALAVAPEWTPGSARLIVPDAIEVKVPGTQTAR